MVTTTSSPAEINLATVQARTELALDHMFAHHGEPLRALMPEADDLLAGLRTLITGGKRLRPLFFWWGYHAVAEQPSPTGSATPEPVDFVAAAFELFHAAALLHDDVMDRSDTRRGAPALHKKLEQLFAERNFSGDAAQFGVSGAILAGDLCLSWSESAFAEAMAHCTAPAAQLSGTRVLFDQMRAELMVGQYLDMSAQAKGLAHNTVPGALRVITHKSAQYSMTYPVLIGATLAGAGAETLTALRAFGDGVGLAFQLRDDLLGVFGDPAQTGKPAGDDLTEGKQTVLLAFAKDRLAPADVQKLTTVMAEHHLTTADLEHLRHALRACGAVAAVEELIDQQCATAQAALAQAQLSDDGRQALQVLVRIATDRAV